jgi:beta-xylosidase
MKLLPMKNIFLLGLTLACMELPSVLPVQADSAQNPIIYADVPDMAMIRVGDTYYMSSTTMHMSPGLPIMKSKDLVNWQLVNYAYDMLDDVDDLNLANGKNAYGKGSWASSLRYHDGTFYATTFSGTTGKTYIYTTKDMEHGPWKVSAFKPMLHDHSLFFDDDGRVFMANGGGDIRLTELTADASAVKPGGFNQVIITNASAVAGMNIGLSAEGSQMFKIAGKYYLFNITWPRGGMRTVIVHRADKITGPYVGRVALQDKGVAQGGLIDTPSGEWFAYLFRDDGAVGRIPYLVPVKWEDGWPVLGENGKVPDRLNLPASKGLMPGIVAPDEFERQPGEPALPLVWQWNHNPDNRLWSVTARAGFLRLATGRVDNDFLSARNTLTQRTLGPECSGTTSVDASNLKDGDFAGLALLQKKYGLVGVKADGVTNYIVMVNAESGSPVEMQRVPLAQKTVFLKADCDFKERADKAHFFYSLNGKTWTRIGGELKMAYTLPHFMGYRFGLFNFATKTTGGFADFDFFRVTAGISAETNSAE